MRQDETKRQGAEVGQPTTKPDQTSNSSCRPSDFSCAQPLNDRPRTGPANEPPAPSPRAPLPNQAWRSWHRPTREGPPLRPPASFPIHLFDALPLGRKRGQWAVQKSLCPGQGRKPQRARPGTPSFVRRLFLGRLSLLSGLDSRRRRRPSSRDPRFFGHLIISDQSCHPQGLNPELSTDSCSNSARKHISQNLTPNQLPRDLAPKHNGW